MARRCAFVLTVLLGLFAAVPLAIAQDLVALKAAHDAATREVRNLDVAIERQRVENERLAEALLSDEAPVVTVEDLRQAQFEADIIATRLLTLQHRMDEQSEQLQSLNGDIIRASAELRQDERQTLERIVREAGLDLRGRVRASAATVLERLRTYRALSEQNAALSEERLDLVQRAITLDALEGMAEAKDGPLARRISALVDQFSQQALTLANSAAEITDANPVAVARRNLLRLRADEALLRSSTRLTDLAVVEARATLAAFEPVVSEPAIPVRLFDEAIEALGGLDTRLAQRAVITRSNRDALADLARIAREPRHDGDVGEALRQRIGGLTALIADQRAEIVALREEVAAAVERLARERAERDRALLLVRERTRTDAAARGQIAAELRTIPSALEAVYAARLTEVRTSLAVAGWREFALLGAALSGLLALTLWLRQSLLKRFIAAPATQATEVPLEVVRRNLFWLFPVAAWWLFAQVFAISAETTRSILTLIAIPALAASLRDFTQVIVSRRSYGARVSLGALITRATEIALVLSAVFVFGYVLLNEVPLLPSTQSAINRLAYSVFVLSGLPMLLFVFFFAASEGGSHGLVRRTVAGGLSLLPPLALIATGVTGLAGYTRLAGVMLENLAFAIVIVAALALALGILHDLVEGVTARMRRKDPARAYFARANFLRPAARALQAVLLVVAVLVAVEIFEWTADTPFIGEIVAVWQQTVFSTGGQAYSVGSVVFALLAFAFVFWLAGWSRRVAYTVVFGRLRDIGIRQSLSVFAQYVIIVIGVLVTLSAVGFDVTTLTVFAASLGVGIGFGLQNVVNNFISGLLLLVERPLRLGDIVTVGGNSGTVMQIGIRSMRMKTFDEFDLIVPNSALISDTFTNWTRTNSVMRVLLTVGIAYEDDPVHAIDVVYRVLEAEPGVLASPAPMVTADEFADSSINLRVCYYVDLAGSFSAFRVRSGVLSGIWRAFAREGISIPFPQRDLHMIAQRRDVAEGREDTRAAERETEDWRGDAVEMAASDAKDGM